MLSKRVLFLRRGKVLILAGLLLISVVAENLSAEEPNSEPNQSSETIQSEPKCILCGHITDSQTGQPVTDATVIIKHRSNAKTDANGFYCFDKIHKDGEYKIIVDSNEYVGIYFERPTANLNSNKQTIKDFKLDRACMIEFQVVNEANEPIEGAELSVTPLIGQTYREIGNPYHRRRTDKDGILLIGGLPPSTTGYLITATHSIKTKIQDKEGKETVQRRWDYAPGKLTAILDDTNVIELGQIVLQKGVDVKGYAEYKDGVPASELEIYAYPEWWGSGRMPERYPIDANGSFALRNIVPGIYRLSAHIPTREGGSRGITLTQTILPLPNNELLKLTIPEKSPQALASIKGRFSFAGDIPNYVDIDAYSISNKSHPFTMWRYNGTGPCDANFAIDRLEPGKYRLTFLSNGMERKIVEDIEAPTDGLVVELVPRNKTYLTGTVINSRTSQPIRKFKARLKDRLSYIQPGQWFEFDDAEGKFNIAPPRQGIYQIQIAAEGFAWTCSEDINPEENTAVVIKLSSGGSIKGRVLNELGQPVNGAKVLPLSKAGLTTVGRTEEAYVSEDGAVETVDGAFELTNLAAGDESIKVVHPDYMYSTVSGIEVKEGQVTEDIDVILHKGGTVEGYVYNAQFQPQPNVTLCFKEQTIVGIQREDCLATVTTDINGYYRVEGLPEQILNVKREGKLGSMGVVCRMFMPTKGKVSHLDFGGQQPNVTGQIVIDGAALSNRKIMLSMIDAPNFDLFRYYAMTDAEGKFSFGGVPHGRWAIYYDDIETVNNQIKAAEFELTEQSIDLGIIPTGFATVRISIEQEQGAGKWEIIKAHLQDENPYWSSSATEIAIPKDENEPYIAKNILPGEHYLVLMRKDYSSLRYPIEVSENEPNITIHIPKCTAGIHGRITGVPITQTIWTKDKSVIGVIKPDENLNYKLDNLPSGQYFLGGNMLIDSAAFLEFELAEGEQKIFDINYPDSIPPKTLPYTLGSLQVLIVDENGIPLTGANAWLQGGDGIIEPVTHTGCDFYFFTEPGTYTLQTEFPGYKMSEKQVSIEDLSTLKQQPQPVIVRLEKK